jgi:hypothetical protein
MPVGALGTGRAEAGRFARFGLMIGNLWLRKTPANGEGSPSQVPSANVAAQRVEGGVVEEIPVRREIADASHDADALEHEVRSAAAIERRRNFTHDPELVVRLQLSDDFRAPMSDIRSAVITWFEHCTSRRGGEGTNLRLKKAKDDRSANPEPASRGGLGNGDCFLGWATLIGMTPSNPCPLNDE